MGVNDTHCVIYKHRYVPIKYWQVNLFIDLKKLKGAMKEIFYFYPCLRTTLIHIYLYICFYMSE